MIIPIRCFTCGQVVANKSERYRVLLEAGFHESDALDYVGLPRYCCRRMLLTHVEHVDKLIAYQQTTALATATATATAPPAQVQ
jgi:DNA-directed RNA polymerase I, II, and III subunit RPABC5